MDYFDTSRKCSPLGRLFSNAGLAQLFFYNICYFQFSFHWPVFLEITSGLTESPKELTKKRLWGLCVMWCVIAKFVTGSMSFLSAN